MRDAVIVFVLVLVLVAAYVGYRYSTLQPAPSKPNTTPVATQPTAKPVATKTEPETEPEPGAPAKEDESPSSVVKLTKEQADKLHSELPGLALRVVKVIDGDTIDVELPANLSVSGTVRIRYGGIDAPERGAPYSKKSRDKNCRLVEGKSVFLEFDKSYHDSKWGRLAADIFVEPSTGETKRQFAGAEIVRAGLAYVDIFQDNVARAQELAAAQKEARAAKVGLWQQPLKETEKVYVADKTRWRFHRPGCKWAKEIPKDKLVEYKTSGDAYDEGKYPCKECKP